MLRFVRSINLKNNICRGNSSNKGISSLTKMPLRTSRPEMKVTMQQRSFSAGSVAGSGFVLYPLSAMMLAGSIAFAVEYTKVFYDPVIDYELGGLKSDSQGKPCICSDFPDCQKKNDSYYIER